MDASKIKLIIWDLDETFWNGTISEQKVAPVKQACDLVLLSSKKGIVNSICSKNDEKPCIDKLKEWDLDKYFVFNSINWEPKGQRIKDTVESMNLRPCNVLFIDDNKLNDTIIKVLNLLKTRNEKWIDNLPISYKNNSYNFRSDDNSKENLSYLKSKEFLGYLDIDKDDSVDDFVEKLADRYDCKNIENEEEKRNVISVRFNMEKSNFSTTNDYVLAENISNDMMQIVSENTQSMSGVEVDTEVERVYKNGSLAPHIVGTVGKINEEEYNENKGYELNDIIGKFGIEKAFESELRGEVGKAYVEKNSKGNVIGTVETENAKPGNTVWLTIDSGLQKVALESLEYNINQCHSLVANDCVAGGVVMLNVKDFSVLAAASFPTYDISKYSDYDYYTSLSNDETTPLYSRTFDGAFAPGSVFKPCVALAGLEEGKITKDSVITCTQDYDYYPTDIVKCMGYHGDTSLNKALAVSCNYYFAEVGRRLGINTIYSYAEKFGLGLPTGVEINESTGILAGRDSKSWTAGNTVQAAIGQSDNAFTPAQLATYVATIANDGTRLQTHLMKKITSYDRKKTIKENNESNVEVKSTLKVNEENLKAVQKGMWSVCNESDGTAYDVFSNYGVTVAGKTGTAENSGTDHTVFMCYAPYEKPEVAIAVVVEHGSMKKYSTDVAKALLNKYFYNKDYTPSEE